MGLASVSAAEQKAGIRSLYAEFFWGYGAEISLFCLGLLSNWTYKRAYTQSLLEREAAESRVKRPDIHSRFFEIHEELEVAPRPGALA